MAEQGSSKSQVTLQALGLQTSENELSSQNGGMRVASNVIIPRQNIIESRRGFKLFGTSFGSASDRLKQLMEYKRVLLRHYGSTLQYETSSTNVDGERIFNSFSATINEVQDGLRIKSIESNGNLYLTTSNGIQKISATSASNFPTTNITTAGGIKALDIDTQLSITANSTTGFLPVDSAVAYRVVWGERDANNNLILGTPSERSVVYNPLQEMIVRDLMRVLSALDSLDQPGSLIRDGDYVDTLGLPLNATATNIRDNLILLAEKLDEDQGEIFSTSEITSASIAANVCTVTLSDDIAYFGKIAVGDPIYLKGTWTSADGVDISGIRIITAIENDTTPTTFSFNVTAGNGSVSLAGESIKYAWFRNIEEPGEVSTPATAAQLTELDTYLQNIIIELQSDNNTKTVVVNDGTGGLFPSALESASVTGLTTLTIVVNASADLRDIFEVGDVLNLNGQWDTQAPVTNISTFHTVATVNATTLTVTLSNPVTNGGIDYSVDSTVSRVLRFTNTLRSTYIDPLDITTTSNVLVTITVPPDATMSTFYQIYRSSVITATTTDVLADLVPNDEMKLVYEAFPSSSDISSRTIEVVDIVPESFFNGAPNLYTNEISGEGILQANDVPPLAHDVNRYKGVIFYANTQTRQRKTINLLGVSNILADFNNSESPSITVVTTDGATQYNFIKGVQQVTNVTCGSFSDITEPAYFTLYSGNDETAYGVWFAKTNSSVSPVPANLTAIQVNVVGLTTAAQIAQRLKDTISTYPDDFGVSLDTVTSTVQITNTAEGPATNAAIASGLAGSFNITTPTEGAGESTTGGVYNVLLSNEESPAVAVEQTAKSLVRVINKNINDGINAFYLSGLNDVPGQILLEGQALDTPEFYLVCNTSNTGGSFNPNLSPSGSVSIIAGANALIDTGTAHGLETNDEVILAATSCSPTVNGIYPITVVSASTFTISTSMSVNGSGVYIPVEDAEVSDNEVKVNRVYFSKIQQPEAVPILNYLNVGASDKEIIRIMPLRESLFVFKEDGLYRISGEPGSGAVTPTTFTVSLFDSSCILIAPDSLAVSNNVIYGWTNQGIIAVTENGVSDPPISRPIDNLVIPIKNSTYANFSKATWGIGYESDNSYIVFTVSNPNDEVATIAFRYCTLPPTTWTTYDKSNTCGVVSDEQEKLYLGAGDTNYMEEERKNYDRTDYADREISKTIQLGNVVNNTDTQQFTFTTVSDVTAGDVLYQEQTVSFYDFHKLLKKLDIDPNVAPPYSVVSASWSSNSTDLITNTNAAAFIAPGDYVVVNNVNPIGFNGTYEIDAISSSIATISIDSNPGSFISGGTFKYSYYESLKLTAGGSMRDGLEALANKLDIDPGVNDTDYLDQIDFYSANNVSASILNTNTVLITSPNHGLVTNRYIQITGATTTPNINNNYTVTVLSASTFTIPAMITSEGTVSYETLINNFNDIKACYNIIVNKLNLDVGVGFGNYQLVTTTTPLEALITNVNSFTKTLTTSPYLDWQTGPVKIFKAIPTNIEYLPISMDDPLSFKQFREMQVLFFNRTFTNGTVKFASDLSPQFINVPVTGLGKGLFGNEPFGQNYFGGNSNSAPYITYIPRQSQRCRFLRVGFTHNVAREKYQILGVTVTGRTISTRAYR